MSTSRCDSGERPSMTSGLSGEIDILPDVRPVDIERAAVADQHSEQSAARSTLLDRLAQRLGHRRPGPWSAGDVLDDVTDRVVRQGAGDVGLREDADQP